MTKKKRKGYLVIIALLAGLVTLLHSLVLANYPPLTVLEELYYIPLILGILWFGLKGALMTYVLVSILYTPFFFGSWVDSPLAMADRLLHLIFSGIFAFTAGYLVDREKKIRQRAEREQYLVSIGQVATTIVHDLKNPLITILGFAKRIREGKEDIDIAAETIIDSAQNMQKIVHDVLDFSKPIQLNLREEDIRNVAKQAIDSCRRVAEERDITLSIDMPDYPVNILMDSFQIMRALINTINNAVEASSTGQHVAVTISAGKKHLEISVKDYGSGMDKTTLENIFVPFYTKKAGGTGLGMPIAKKIIEGHKGIIRIDSHQWKGTEVNVALPYT
jgi:signal transduction histidine kinase